MQVSSVVAFLNCHLKVKSTKVLFYLFYFFLKSSTSITFLIIKCKLNNFTFQNSECLNEMKQFIHNYWHSWRSIGNQLCFSKESKYEVYFSVKNLAILSGLEANLSSIKKYTINLPLSKQIMIYYNWQQIIFWNILLHSLIEFLWKACESIIFYSKEIF